MSPLRMNWTRSVLILGALLTAAPGFADLKVVSHLKADIVNKVTERDTTSYFKGDFIRFETDKSATIYNVATGNTVVLDLDKKTYYDVPKPSPAAASGMKVDVTASVTPTDEKSKVAGYDCAKFLANLGLSMTPADKSNFTAKTEIGMQIWTTKQLQTPFSPKHILYMVTQMFRGAMVVEGADKIATEMAKVEGFPLNVSTTMTISGIPGMTPPTVKIDQQVRSVVEAPLADSLFQVPADFKKGEARRPRNGVGG